MNDQRLAGIGGWLLVYVICSIPPLMVYSMGLSGWFFEYPLILMVVIFLVLAIPLLLVLLKSPKAPKWNVAMLWAAVVLMTLRSVSVFFEPGSERMSREEALHTAALLSAIVGFSTTWAIAWTLYFGKSLRVRNTFGG